MNNAYPVKMSEGKIIGLIIHNKPKFDSQITSISKKISKSLECIYRLRECLPQNKSKTIF